MENHGGKYDSVLVAKYIVARANEESIDINITKVQKLLYIAYGTCLAVEGVRLTDEHPQAWPYGPVFPKTRRKLLRYSDLSLITLQNEKDLDKVSQDTSVQDLVSLVFLSFGNWTAKRLSEWSHGEGTPWATTVSEEDFAWGNPIPDGLIAPYFKRLLVKK